MTEQTEPTQIISNVATLDLRTTSAEIFSTIKHIENVATILYSAETAAHLASLHMSNVAATLEVAANAKLWSGQTTLGRNSLQQQSEPIEWIVAGQLFVEASLSAEELNRGMGSLVVAGQVICPDHLSSVLQSKVKHINGQFVIYPRDAIIVVGKLALTDPYLRQLPDSANLLILGKLSAVQRLSPELLAQKLGQLLVYGKVICAEENMSLVRALQGQPNFGEITIVPAGFELVERPLILDAELLETFSARKLYCTGLVNFGDDVTPQALESAIDKVVATRLLLAPSPLRKTLAQKCDLLQTQAIFYTGKLWLVEDEVTLDQAWFDLLEGQATLVVTGAVQLEPSLDAKLLTTRLHRVHNLGEITATKLQLATLQARTGQNEGSWTDGSQQVDEVQPTIGNAAYLKL